MLVVTLWLQDWKVCWLLPYDYKTEKYTGCYLMTTRLKSMLVVTLWLQDWKVCWLLPYDYKTENPAACHLNDYKTEKYAGCYLMTTRLKSILIVIDIYLWHSENDVGNCYHNHYETQNAGCCPQQLQMSGKMHPDFVNFRLWVCHYLRGDYNTWHLHLFSMIWGCNLWHFRTRRDFCFILEIISIRGRGGGCCFLLIKKKNYTHHASVAQFKKNLYIAPKYQYLIVIIIIFKGNICLYLGTNRCKQTGAKACKICQFSFLLNKCMAFDTLLQTRYYLLSVCFLLVLYFKTIWYYIYEKMYMI